MFVMRFADRLMESVKIIISWGRIHLEKL